MVPRHLPARLLLSLVTGAGLVTLAFACGSEDSTQASPAADASAVDATTDAAESADVTVPPPGDIEAFCAGTLALHAPRYEGCCEKAAAPKRYAFDDALLKALAVECTEALGASVKGGRAAFDAAAAATCEANVSASIQGKTCPEVLHSPNNQPNASIFAGAAGCPDALVGRQPADAPCSNDYECTDGLTCVGWTSKSDGVCKPPPGDGASCGYAIPDGGGFIELVKWGFGTHPRCAEGFFCDATATQQGICRARAAATGPCDRDEECADGLRCQLGTCGTAGPAPADATCKRNTDCQDGLVCKSADGGSVCAPRAAAGTPCSSEFGFECAGACVKPDGGSATCVAYCGSL